MSLETQLAGAVKEARKVFDLVTGQFNKWDGQVKAQIEKLGENIINDGTRGSTQFNIAKGFYSSSTDAGYIHIKLPIKVNIDVDMFHITLRGHGLYHNILDAKFTGYSYGDRGLTNVGVSGKDNPVVYTSSDGYVVCRVSSTNMYYITAVVDSIYVGNGRAFKKGDIKIEFSTSENI